MKKQLNFSLEDIEQHYAARIAQLEVQLAREIASKNAVIKYAEELEQELESKVGEGESEKEA